MNSVKTKRVVALSISIIQYLLGCILFTISLVWPRDDTIWVFGAQRSKGFEGNPKYLYLYTAKERRNIRPIWLSRDEQILEELRADGFEAYHADSVHGMYANLRAGVVFVSHGMGDVNKWCCGGATSVSLWHGVALKKIQWDYGLKGGSVTRRLYRNLIWKLFTHPDRIVVTSTAMIEPFASAFRVDPEQILVAGYPRNDALLGEFPELDTKSPHLYDKYERLHEKGTVIIYTPTYREGSSHYLEDQLYLSELNHNLTELDAYLIIKPHPWEDIDIRESEFSRITQAPPELDIYPILKHTDVLITDYSSIYFDYLALDKKVVHYPFDLEEYEENRGFYLDYESIAAGPIATDFTELIESISAVVESDEYARERQVARNRFLNQPSETRCKQICDHFDPLS